MKRETVEKIEKASHSFRYRNIINSPIILIISKLTPIISFCLCTVTVFVLTVAMDKFSIEFKKAIFMSEEKHQIKEVPIYIKDTVNNCDTVFIINGEAYKKQ